MEHPTHDTVEPVRFDKAWQRAAYHAKGRNAKLDSHLDDQQLLHRRQMKQAQRRELDKMIEEVKASRPLWISYEEAAEILVVGLRQVASLAAMGIISSDVKRRIARRSSVEAYRDTRKA